MPQEIARGRTLRTKRGVEIPAGTLVARGRDGELVVSTSGGQPKVGPGFKANGIGDELGTMRRELQETRAALQTATARVERLEKYMGPSMLARLAKLETRRGG